MASWLECLAFCVCVILYVRYCNCVTCLLILKVWPLTHTWVASLLQIGCFPLPPACQMSYSMSGKYDYDFSFMLFQVHHFKGKYSMLKVFIRKYHLKLKIVCDAFRSSETTQACKQGRSATVRLRCNPTVTTKNLITLPRYCSMGTTSAADLTRLFQAVFNSMCYFITTEQDVDRGIKPQTACFSLFSSLLSYCLTFLKQKFFFLLRGSK